MNEDLSGRVAIVTGGGSGIGRAVCHELARAGMSVAVVDKRAAAAETVAAEVAALGGTALALAANIGDEGNIATALETAVGNLGGLHVVVANAGVNGMRAPIDELTLEEWSSTIDTNLTGTFLTIKHAIPYLRTGGGGSIIVTSSLNGNTVFSSAGFAAYSTSKAAQVAFARMAAFECARWNIRVNAILPGSIETDIEERTERRNLDRIAYQVQMPEHYPPLYGRRGTPEEVADLILFLASDSSRYMTGAVIAIDGAVSLVRS